MSNEQRPPIPAKISAAIAAVSAEVRAVAVSAHNSQGNYDFASIDDFMEEVRPLLGKHGLVILQDEESWEIRAGEGTTSAGKERGANLICEYSFTLSVAEQTWGYRPKRTAMVLASMGPQAFGAAQSYAEKLFLRSLFKIATGAPDVDGVEGGELSPGTREGGKEAIARAAELLVEQRLGGIKGSGSLAEAKAAWADVQRDWPIISEPDRQRLIAARDTRRVELQAAEAAQRPAAAANPAPAATAPAPAQEPEGSKPAPAERAFPGDEPPAPDTPEAPQASDVDPNDPFGLDALERAKGARAAAPATRPGANRGGAKTA